MAKKAADNSTPTDSQVGTQPAVTFPALPPERETIPLRQLVRVVATFPLDKVMPLTDAFVRVKNLLGSGQPAALDLTKHARAGRVTVVALHVERGDIEQVFIFRRAFWQYCKIVVSNPFDVNRPEGASVVRIRRFEMTQGAYGGPQLAGRWYFFVIRRRFDRLYSTPAPGKPPAQRPPPKQSQPQSPKPTSSKPAVASEEELHGTEKDVYKAMKDDPPRKGKRNYATSLWNRCFKKKGVSKKYVQNVVSKHRKEFEIEADDVRDPQKPPKKSSRRK